MVRAGESGRYSTDFERLSIVAIGWAGVGDLAQYASLSELRQAVAENDPSARPGNVLSTGSALWKFKVGLARGDRVVTYDAAAREYLLGTIVGDYFFEPGLVLESPHTRKVSWQGRVGRDRLSAATKNTLGSISTLFQPSEDALAELIAPSDIPEVDPGTTVSEEAGDAALEEVRLDVSARAKEFIKDRILSLSPDDMEKLVACILRAVGYRARVTQKGPDRGRDVLASPDGLGFQSPRIMGEVKHRPKERMGSDEVRSFLGGLRSGDCGLYVSTGGFTREAKYEADRANVPITLLDLDEIAAVVIEHYDAFDAEGRALISLVKVYWPAR